MIQSFLTMTADEIKNYKGPVFRAQVQWNDDNDKLWSSDFECSSMGELHRMIDDCRWSKQVHTISYGPHTKGENE